MTNQVITNTNGTAWSLAKADSPSNTALAGRFHDLAMLLEGATGPNQLKTSRAGVISTAPASAGTLPTPFYVVATGSGLGLACYGGEAIVERGTYSGVSWSTFTPAGTGPYAVALWVNGSFSANAASTSSTRIDRVDLQVLDGPGYGDNGGVSLVQVIYTPGTAGSGVAPNGPANSIPLATITIPANTTTLTQGMVTDTRRSAGIRGAVRVLLPGDALSDIGYNHGELRDTSVITTLPTLDRWNQYTSAWETLSVLGVGASLCYYYDTTATSNITSGTPVAVAFDTAVNTTPLVTVSGTSNTTFTVNKTGTYSVNAGSRVGAYTMQAFFALTVGGTQVAGYNALASAQFQVGNLSWTGRISSGTAIQHTINGTGTGLTAPSGRLQFMSVLYEGA